MIDESRRIPCTTKENPHPSILSLIETMIQKEVECQENFFVQEFLLKKIEDRKYIEGIKHLTSK